MIVGKRIIKILESQTKLARKELSSHLSKFQPAGCVEIKNEFVEKIPRTLLRLTEEGRNAFMEYRQKMQRVLDSF